MGQGGFFFLIINDDDGERKAREVGSVGSENVGESANWRVTRSDGVGVD